MELVEHHARNAFEERVVVQSAEQHAGRHNEYPRACARFLVEPHLIAEQITEGRAVFECHSACRGSRGHAPRFEHQHQPVPNEAALDDGGRYAGGLPGAGRGSQHDGAVRAQRGE